MIQEHLVELKIGNILISSWQRFRLYHDMTQAADSFDMTFGVTNWDPAVEPQPIIEQLRAYANAFGRVELFVDGAKQMTGFIDTVAGNESGAGAAIQVNGRDIGGQLEDEAMPKGFNVKGLTLLELLDQVMGKWGVTIRIGNEDNRAVVVMKKKAYQYAADKDVEWLKQQKWWKNVVGKPTEGYEFSTSMVGTDTLTSYALVVANRKILAEVKPKPDDTKWDFVTRVLRSQNLMGWFAANGDFTVATPNYNQDPLYHVTSVVHIPGKPLPRQRTSESNNVEEGDIQESPGQRYSAVYVFGRQGKTPIRAEAHDMYLEALQVDRPWYHTDKNIKDLEEAQRVADRLLYESQIRGTEYSYKLTGFGQGPHIFATDTVYDVWDDSPARYVHGQFYCPKIVMEYDVDQGPSTTVTLQPKGIIEVPSS